MVNLHSGLFIWTPTAQQSPSTNLVTVRVADNGTPSLSAARTFQVFVITGPRLSGITRLPAGKISLTFGTVVGKTYRLEYKDRLSDALWARLSPDTMAQSTSLTIEDDMGARAQRFYRVVQLD